MFKIALSVSLLLTPFLLSAETADDYFHGAAQSYVWGNKNAALSNVVTGLRLYPTDPKLSAIAGLLKKQEEQKQNQQQQNQQQQQQDQKKDQNQQQQQQQQAQQQQAEQKNNGQNQQEQQQQQAQQKSQSQPQDEQQKQQPAQQASAQPKDKADDKDQGEGKAYAEGEMTPQQAKQLLDAQKGQEQMLPPEKTNQKPPERNHPLRDW